MLREGLVLRWYLDSLGKWTAGYGHLRQPGEENLTVTRELAEKWLEQDLSEARSAALKQAKMLPFTTKHLLDVLVSVNFQLGTSWYKKFPKTWGLMVKGEFYEAANEAQRSTWYKQTPVRVRDFQAALRDTQAIKDKLEAERNGN